MQHNSLNMRFIIHLLILFYEKIVYPLEEEFYKFQYTWQLQ